MWPQSEPRRVVYGAHVFKKYTMVKFKTKYRIPPAIRSRNDCFRFSTGMFVLDINGTHRHRRGDTACLVLNGFFGCRFNWYVQFASPRSNYRKKKKRKKNIQMGEGLAFQPLKFSNSFRRLRRRIRTKIVDGRVPGLSGP